MLRLALRGQLGAGCCTQRRHTAAAAWQEQAGQPRQQRQPCRALPCITPRTRQPVFHEEERWEGP